MKQTQAIEVSNLSVAYNAQPVLWTVDLNVPQGVLMAIVGPNGAGKSTLLKAMLQLVPRVSGSVRINKRDKQHVSYVPQRGNVDWDFPITVKDVVLMGRYGHIGWIKRPTQADKTVALQALTQLELTNVADRQISELSGGQQQRVFLARALAQQAEIYFLDEPLQGVDAKTEQIVMKLLRKLRDEGKTILVVHHDVSTVARYFDWVTLLRKRVIASGPVEQVFTNEKLQETYQGQLHTASDAGCVYE